MNPALSSRQVAQFDQNQWYQITVDTSDSLSMAGTELSEHRAGSVFFQVTNTSAPLQRWQLFPSKNSTYILRSQSGPQGYLGASAKPSTKSEQGGTTAIMSNHSIADNGVFWHVNTFHDGRSYLNNLANGTAWNLMVKSAGSMAMTSDIKGEQDRQSFSFTKLGAINDPKYSTIINPGDSTPTNHPSPSSLPSQTSGHSSGLSTGAYAAIGASIAAAIIAFVVGLLFLFRRRRRMQKHVPEKGIDTGGVLPHEYPNIPISEPQPAHPLYELQSNELAEMYVPPTVLPAHEALQRGT
ncbi:hypothetical protein BU16DRAFT_620563 [Lophium mytilinum]|uniref:Ricin B lectin domain-containing protein n=1 Tax=Lophium mytilinum TaxID=390894 RepID=A0A6A6QIW0_9PEZI|nr:hypothetical protein BU16DRAFT_620563 [Lophium mytilinum]